MHPHVTPAIALLILIAAGLLARRLLRPFTTCRHCHGYGRVPTRTGRGRARPCRKCQGHGVRPRLNHRASRAARRTYHDTR